MRTDRKLSSLLLTTTLTTHAERENRGRGTKTPKKRSYLYMHILLHVAVINGRGKAGSPTLILARIKIAAHTCQQGGEGLGTAVDAGDLAVTSNSSMDPDPRMLSCVCARNSILC